MQVDLPLEQLRTFQYEVDDPEDFDAFWASTLETYGAGPLHVRRVEVDTGLRSVECTDLTFAGYGGSDVRAWVIRPADRAGPAPVVVEYLGYGGGRSHPIEFLPYASAGFVHLVMDTRGQGSVTRPGDTEDRYGSGPAAPGFLTKGLPNRDAYYYRRLFVDAYRAVDVAKTLPGVDQARVVVTGRSQGGAMSLVAAGLRTDVALAVPHVPLLCAFRRALRITDREPFAELGRWLGTHRLSVDEALDTLRYFDGVAFARRASCLGSFSVALNDLVAPPSSVFAAHNAYGGPTEITVWPFNGHEAGGPEDVLRTIRAVRALEDRGD